MSSDDTTTWLGRTYTFESIWRMVSAGINPWTGQPTTLEQYKADRGIS